MRTIIYAALVASSVGCSTTTNNNPVCGDGIVDGTEQCDDGSRNGTVGDACSATCSLVGGGAAHVTVSWSLKSAVSGSTATCPPGFDTAALYSQEVDATGHVIGSPIIDLFNCTDGTGRTGALNPAYYEEWIEIANHDNSSQFARSKSNLEEAPAQLIDLTTADLTYTTEVVIDGGFFRLGWNLVGASSGSPLTCAQAGASGGVEAISTEVNTTNAVSDVFHTCTNLEGVTFPLPSASYTISVDALNSAMQSVGTAPTLTNQVIMQPGALKPVSDLGVINIPITGM